MNAAVIIVQLLTAGNNTLLFMVGQTSPTRGDAPSAATIDRKTEGSKAMSGRSDVDFASFVWIWNTCQSVKTPRLHLIMAHWLAERWASGDRELLLLAFRNSGKSTLVGLYCAWLLLTNPNLRVLVLASDFSLARSMVRNIKRVIERHPFTRHLRPERADQWAADQFTVKRKIELREPSVRAKGISANITGLRADIIICDDVEVPNTCDTEQKRLDLRLRLQEIDYVLMPGGTKLFIGTPHTYYSIYASEARKEIGETRAFLDGFARLYLPLISKDGRCQWPERFPPEKVEAIRSRTGPAKFESQMLLRPRSATESRLDPDRLRPYDAELSYSEGNGHPRLTLEGRRLLSASCWWDPAFGAPEKGDSSVVAAVYIDEDEHYWLHQVLYLHTCSTSLGDQDAATAQCQQVAAFARAFHIPAIAVETNGVGRFLPGLLRNEFKRDGISCAVLERTTTRRKDDRILDAFDSLLAAGRLRAHQRIWSTPFVEEMREWRPGSKGRDDGLDAVAGCLLNEPVRLSLLSFRTRPSGSRGAWWPIQATTIIDSDFLLPP